jgi:hypothetical protein
MRESVIIQVQLHPLKVRNLSHFRSLATAELEKGTHQHPPRGSVLHDNIDVLETTA